jgi:hypothetical protein
MMPAGPAFQPGPRLIATRELMERLAGADLAVLDPAEPGNGRGTARWLAGQLPASDPVLLGWAVVTVAAAMYPTWYEPGLGDILARGTVKPGTGRGMSAALLMAYRVGAELIDLGPGLPPAGGPLEVGPEIAVLNFTTFMSSGGSEDGEDLSGELAFLRTAAQPSVDEVRQLLAEELPAVDVQAVGWVLVAIAVLLCQQIARFEAPPLKRRVRRRARPLLAGARSGMSQAAVALGLIGDDLSGNSAA